MGHFLSGLHCSPPTRSDTFWHLMSKITTYQTKSGVTCSYNVTAIGCYRPLLAKIVSFKEMKYVKFITRLTLQVPRITTWKVEPNVGREAHTLQIKLNWSVWSLLLFPLIFISLYLSPTLSWTNFKKVKKKIPSRKKEKRLFLS